MKPLIFPVSSCLQYLDMRQELVAYVAEVAGALRLRDETVHLAMAYADRCRARVQAQGAKMLLSAVACLVVAAKFEENAQDVDGNCTTPSYSHVVQAMGNPPGRSH